MTAIRTLTANGALASREQVLAEIDGGRFKVAGVLVDMLDRGELKMSWNDELRDFVFVR